MRKNVYMYVPMIYKVHVSREETSNFENKQSHSMATKSQGTAAG